MGENGASVEGERTWHRFSRYAEICGARGIRVTEAGELDRAIAEALAHDGPAMVAVVADAELV